MAKDTAGEGDRKRAVTNHTQVKNPQPGDWTKRNENKAGGKTQEFMAAKKDGKPFKGVAKEPDKLRNQA